MRDCLIQFGLLALESSLLWPKTVKPPRSNRPFLQGHQWQKQVVRSKTQRKGLNTQPTVSVELIGRLSLMSSIEDDSRLLQRTRRVTARVMTDFGETENRSCFSYWGNRHPLASCAVPLADEVLSWSWELLWKTRMGLRFKEHVTAHCFVSRRVLSQGWLKPNSFSLEQQQH